MKFFLDLFSLDFPSFFRPPGYRNYCAKNPHMKYRYKLPQNAPQIIRRENVISSKGNTPQKGRSPLYRLETIKKRNNPKSKAKSVVITPTQPHLHTITSFNRFNNNWKLVPSTVFQFLKNQWVRCDRHNICVRLKTKFGKVDAYGPQPNKLVITRCKSPQNLTGACYG